MINITDKHNCVGCRACEQICPKQCISISGDNEGFIYPAVDQDRCIECHLCEKVCPVLNSSSPTTPIMALGCKAESDEVRLKSSSGGIFSLLAEDTIKKDGIVFGAVFNENFHVRQSCIDNKAGLDRLRRSKYVQSDTVDTYRSVKDALEAGRYVLYCGTPCQIKGLKLYLRKDYENLLTVDFICHGVPSPKVWQDYIDGLREEVGDGNTLKSVNFRSKAAGGWHKFALEFNFENQEGKATDIIQYPRDNPYYQLFSKM